MLSEDALDYLSGDDVSGDRTMIAILKRVSVQLNDIAALVEAAETHFDMGEGETFSDERLHFLQGVDLAVQKARGLAEFVTQLSHEMPAEWRVDLTTAINVIKLTEMRRHLGGDVSDADALPVIKKASGDFDLF